MTRRTPSDISGIDPTSQFLDWYHRFDAHVRALSREELRALADRAKAGHLTPADLLLPARPLGQLLAVWAAPDRSLADLTVEECDRLSAHFAADDPATDEDPADVRPWRVDVDDATPDDDQTDDS